MKLSVVTVTFNDRERLAATCESLKQQRGIDFEHLLIDGCSSDGTIDAYLADPPVRTHRVVSEKDAGIFDAMNKGLKLAAGEYVLFLNAGDELAHGDALRDGVARLESKNALWGYGRARITSRHGGDARPPVGAVPYDRRRHWYGFATICHQAVTMRTDYLREVGGFAFERFGYASDYHLLLQAASHERPVVSPSIDVEYEAGGVSEQDIYRQLWRRHRARSAVRGKNSVADLADGALTGLQMAYVGLRRLLKLLLRTAGIRSFLGRRTARTGE